MDLGDRDFDKATMLWFDEKEFYDYGDGCQSGEVCGHYTQVWTTTRSQGKGMVLMKVHGWSHSVYMKSG